MVDPHNREVSFAISLPTLNERFGIEKVLSQITRLLVGLPYTVCIVDDGSTDGTVEFIENLMANDPRITLIKNIKQHYGCQRGAASRIALEWLVENTNHQVFVEMDADYSQRPEEIINGGRVLIDSDYDILIASKYIVGSKVVGRSRSRNLISYCYSALARSLFRQNIRDYSNGFRFYSRNAAECLLQFRPKYTSPVYLLEILTIWFSNGFTVGEIPTIYVDRDTGQSKVKFIDLIKGLLGTLDIAHRYYRKYYYMPT
jgi:dolichol-phosphate mannosyltransferase